MAQTETTANRASAMGEVPLAPAPQPQSSLESSLESSALDDSLSSARFGCRPMHHPKRCVFPTGHSGCRRIGRRSALRRCLSVILDAVAGRVGRVGVPLALSLVRVGGIPNRRQGPPCSPLIDRHVAVDGWFDGLVFAGPGVVRIVVRRQCRWQAYRWMTGRRRLRIGSVEVAGLVGITGVVGVRGAGVRRRIIGFVRSHVVGRIGGSVVGHVRRRIIGFVRSHVVGRIGSGVVGHVRRRVIVMSKAYSQLRPKPRPGSNRKRCRRPRPKACSRSLRRRFSVRPKPRPGSNRKRGRRPRPKACSRSRPKPRPRSRRKRYRRPRPKAYSRFVRSHVLGRIGSGVVGHVRRRVLGHVGRRILSHVRRRILSFVRSHVLGSNRKRCCRSRPKAYSRPRPKACSRSRPKVRRQ